MIGMQMTTLRMTHQFKRAGGRRKKWVGKEMQSTTDGPRLPRAGTCEGDWKMIKFNEQIKNYDG